MPSLFDRVPPLTFAPLAVLRHGQYWDLLLHLYDARFGPDATPAEGDGFSQRAITLEIEKFLAGITLASVDDALDTPLNIRANTDYRYLVDTGWLREDRIGVKRFVSMPTGLQRMLELLRQFAEEGPQHIGGKVQIIFWPSLASRPGQLETWPSPRKVHCLRATSVSASSSRSCRRINWSKIFNNCCAQFSFH